MEVKEFPAQPIASIHVETTMPEIGKAMHDILPAVWQHVQSSGGQPAGPPFSRYHSMSSDTVVMDAGIPVAAPITGNDRVVAGELPAGKVATAWHIGPYDTLSTTWKALDQWIREQGLEPAGAPWEVYWSDPGAEPDSSLWKTELCWPVR